MHFEHSERSRHWLQRVQQFMDAHVYPAIPLYQQQLAEVDRWREVPPVFEELKRKARAAGL